MPELLHTLKKHLAISFSIPIVVAAVIVILVLVQLTSQSKNLSQTQKQLASIEKQYIDLKNQDQFKRNETLQAQIKAIESSYKDALKTYETIQDLRAQKQKTDVYEKLFTQSLAYLSERNYASSDATLVALNKQIKDDQAKAQAALAKSDLPAAAANAPASNAPPGSGFSVQKVSTDVGDFTIAIVAADLNSTRVIVDTASDVDCSNNCPVLPLGDYVARNGAFAGINGTYFCPAEYPSCAGKTNSFDLLVMNKNKHYFNSDNNVYSNNPAVIFQGSSARFVGHTSEWGRDTSVDAVLSNFPLLVSGGNVVYSDNPDPKFNSKGPRGFIANRGSTVYIGFVYNATMGESARTMKTLGMENAMNLDEGGSTALWSGGYKLGPGRNIPNAILFMHK